VNLLAAGFEGQTIGNRSPPTVVLLRV